MSETALVNKICTACDVNAKAATDDERDQWMQQLPYWQIIEVDGVPQLQRLFSFDNFMDAMNFAQHIAALAEQYDHHPAILIEWGKCQVNWWTHKINGLHQNDFILAAHSDRLFS